MRSHLCTHQTGRSNSKCLKFKLRHASVYNWEFLVLLDNNSIIYYRGDGELSSSIFFAADATIPLAIYEYKFKCQKLYYFITYTVHYYIHWRKWINIHQTTTNADFAHLSKVISAVTNFSKSRCIHDSLFHYRILNDVHYLFS